MRHFLVFCLLSMIGFSSTAQYWFGPKFGMSYIDHVYQESTYESDSFNVPHNVNFQAGAVFEYTATGIYSVYAELMYERIGRTVKNLGINGEPDGQNEFSKMTNHFITIPVMLRVTLGSTPFHYYANGGPRISYWVAGNGSHDLQFFEEFGPTDEDGNPIPIDYKITFRSSKSAPGDLNTGFVSEPNRIQFGLALGGGMIFDMAGGGRLQLDFRMNWVHSNMAKNTSRDTNLVHGVNTDADYYRENFEYYHNIGSVSVAYMFGYNSQLKRKGKSTSDESNKRKKK